jgi:hypothetical protein
MYYKNFWVNSSGEPYFFAPNMSQRARFCCLNNIIVIVSLILKRMVQQGGMLARQTASVHQGGIRLLGAPAFLQSPEKKLSNVHIARASAQSLFLCS